MTRRYHKYAPVLRYLLVRTGMYVDKDGYLVSGQEAWCNSDLWHRNTLDAKGFRKPGDELIKLRIYAQREAPRLGNKANPYDVPKAGDIAFSQGWDVKANPHSSDTPDAMRWLSDWWRANADAFESHIYGEEA